MRKRKLLLVLCIAVFYLITINELYAEIKGVKPSEACDLFHDSGLSTSGWRIYYDYVCGCSSEHEYSISTDKSLAYLSYSVEGTCKSIRRIKLSVEIENQDSAEKLVSELKDAARVLIEKITEQPVPEKIFNAIAEEKSLSIEIGETIVTVARVDWTRITEGETVSVYQIMVLLE